MKMLLNNHFENATESLKSNKVRTYLSIFGIMVGIASITIILSLLTGTSRLFGDRIYFLFPPIAGRRKGVKPFVICCASDRVRS